MLKNKMLWIVLSVVIAMFWWWFNQNQVGQNELNQRELNQNELSQMPKNPEIEQVRAHGQPLAEDRMVENEEEPVSLDVPRLDDGIVQFKFRNLKRLMSTPIDTLDEYQLEMVVQQIIIGLPDMVSIGLMHPLDATFAHTQAMARKNHKLQAFEVEAINKSYMDLYPYPINSSVLDLH